MSKKVPLLKLLMSQLRKQPNQLSKNSWLVVGLGNPGPNYFHNRHNVGHMVVDELARHFGTSFRSHRTGALVAEFKMAGGDKIVLAKSTGFMNLSGAPVQALEKFFSIPNSQLIVIHDELDLAFGDIRSKFDGGHAGHNGLRDISAKCGTDYHRVRFGIGRPPGQQPVADYVLSNFSNKERSELALHIARAAELAGEIIESNQA